VTSPRLEGRKNPKLFLQCTYSLVLLQNNAGRADTVVTAAEDQKVITQGSIVSGSAVSALAASAPAVSALANSGPAVSALANSGPTVSALTASAPAASTPAVSALAASAPVSALATSALAPRSQAAIELADSEILPYDHRGGDSHVFQLMDEFDEGVPSRRNPIDPQDMEDIVEDDKVDDADVDIRLQEESGSSSESPKERPQISTIM
jgi:hypothetical protein